MKIHIPLMLASALVIVAPTGTSAQVLSSAEPDRAPGSLAGGRVMTVLGGIASTLLSTRYTHDTVINPRVGRYDMDCSAMAAWVLRRSAPTALASLASNRPVAVDFYRAVRDAPQRGRRTGWMRVQRLLDARPGDVLAWPRPRWFPSRNTGHVAFVIERPVAHEGAVLVRIADATTIPHENDSRAGTLTTGFGQGTLMIRVDPTTGEGSAYGWAGRRTPPDWMIETPVLVGRVLR